MLNKILKKYNRNLGNQEIKKDELFKKKEK